jgi:hypothetical protein
MSRRRHGSSGRIGEYFLSFEMIVIPSRLAQPGGR